MEYIKFHIAFFVFLFIFKNKINLSFLIYLLKTLYDLLDKLIKKIKLYIDIQRYTICYFYTKKLSYIRLLETCYFYYD